MAVVDPLALQSWTVGSATVTAVVEACTPGIPAGFMIPDATADDIRSTDWLVDAQAGSDGTIAMSVQAFLLTMPGFTVLIDPCVGNGKTRALPFWNRLDIPWLDRLRAAGAEPESIDLVVHTHLHADHVGWDTHLVDGAWVPTFTNARHVYAGEELEYWRAHADEMAGEAYHDSVAPIVHAGLADIVEVDAELGHGLRFVSTPGHTPGHVSLEITNDDDGFVVSGDLIHHPAQMANPQWQEMADTDPVVSRATREAFLDTHALAGTRIAGTHFPVLPVGRVVAHAGRWKFETEPGVVRTPAGA